MVGLRTKGGFLILSVATGFVMSLPWYGSGSGIVLFFAVVPLLYIEDFVPAALKKSVLRTCMYQGLVFLTWGISSGWWLANATVAGTVFLIVLDALLYTCIMLLYHWVKAGFGKFPGYVSLVSFWIAFEYLYLNAELSVPWLNLGNGLSHHIRMVQWFEYTGCLGGSVWVLILNILLYETLLRFLSKKPVLKYLTAYAVLLLFPVLISIMIFRNYTQSGEQIDVLSVQPNVDPYEKFISFTPRQQTDTLLSLSRPYLNGDLDYIITPETSITAYTDIDALKYDASIEKARRLTEQYPQLNVVLGMTLSRTYSAGDSIPSTAGLNYAGQYFDTYNSAVQVNRCSIQYYHKSKLFPGVETMPYAEHLKFLNNLMVRLGGTYRSHGVSPERKVLSSCDGSVRAAPVICWENIYGEFVTGYIRNGANVIFNITNEGWWGNTPGHKMFNKYAQLRAVETRRSVVRSANTGISSLINQKGEIMEQLTWGIKGAIEGYVYLNEKQTFYTRHGDFTGRIFRVVSVIFILALIIRSVIARAGR